MIKTQQELDQKINSLQQELEELKKIKIEDKKEKTRARKGGLYYSLALDYNEGPIIKQYFDEYTTGDDILFYTGNYSLTVSGIKAIQRKEKAYIRIMKYIYDNDLYFEPDWNNEYQNKYEIFYNNYLTRCIVATEKSDIKLPRFKSEKDVSNVLNNCKEDLEIYFK